MADKFVIKPNEKQQEAIDILKGQVMLLAGPGTGKTFTVINRIEKMLSDGVDPSSILCLTFSDAAASEMRERILDAIYKQIEKNPDDQNLQKQIILLNKASICTIDSFCLDVIKNNFYEIDVSANTRIADSTEMLLLKQEVLCRVSLFLCLEILYSKIHQKTSLILTIRKCIPTIYSIMQNVY